MKIPPLPSLSDTIRRHNLAADKSLGQHFLLDEPLLTDIVRQAGDLTGVHVIEIGPGPGGLTRALLASPVAHVTAIEFDPRAIATLAELASAYPTRLTLHHGDALKLDPATLAPAPRAIVANLPYNIGSALLTTWLGNASAYQSLTLMFQKEVAERLCAAPNTSAYGRLSILTQWLTTADIRMTIPAASFHPPPKVDSALVHLVPKPNQPPQAAQTAMSRLTAAAFGQRRKMLRSSLKPLNGDTLLTRAGIDPTRRAETLSVAEFETLLSGVLAGL
jgi:16S rRNA (adenine1518-N6/adenine1519-N6)-dimethyltransferase